MLKYFKSQHFPLKLQNTLSVNYRKEELTPALVPALVPHNLNVHFLLISEKKNYFKLLILRKQRKQKDWITCVESSETGFCIHSQKPHQIASRNKEPFVPLCLIKQRQSIRIVILCMRDQKYRQQKKSRQMGL